MDSWRVKYPEAFESDVVYGTGEYLKRLKVNTSDVEWRIPVSDIPLTRKGISYSNGDVSNKDKVAYVDKLVEQGVLREWILLRRVF